MDPVSRAALEASSKAPRSPTCDRFFEQVALVVHEHTLFDTARCRPVLDHRSTYLLVITPHAPAARVEARPMVGATAPLTACVTKAVAAEKWPAQIPRGACQPVFFLSMAPDPDPHRIDSSIVGP